MAGVIRSIFNATVSHARRKPAESRSSSTAAFRIPQDFWLAQGAMVSRSWRPAPGVLCSRLLGFNSCSRLSGVLEIGEPSVNGQFSTVSGRLMAR